MLSGRQCLGYRQCLGPPAQLARPRHMESVLCSVPDMNNVHNCMHVGLNIVMKENHCLKIH